MSKLQPARGTRDIYGDDARRMRRVTDTFERVAGTYGFEPINTPIFEFTEVFKRPLGEASDIVSKEMYSFEDRGGEEITLRPEFTAGVCRSFISEGMQQRMPCRLMSHGPAFRYERPQKGRFRQFHQLNAECLGPADPASDVDMIAMAWRVLCDLGVDGDVVLQLNTLGDSESRTDYRAALVDYFSKHEASLSEDSQTRLTKNPLRILDSKDAADIALVGDAPKLSDFLNDASRTFFDAVKAGLKASGVPFELNERLVRGMDYYNHTAFEFVTTTLGSQGTVIGGGRYDGLIKQLGGPPTPGVGWAGGIERLAMMLKDAPAETAPVVFLPIGDDAIAAGYGLCDQLRAKGITVISDRSGNLKKRFNRADKLGASHTIVLGDDELEKQVVMVKNQTTGDQAEVAFNSVADYIMGSSS